MCEGTYVHTYCDTYMCASGQFPLARPSDWSDENARCHFCRGCSWLILADATSDINLNTYPYYSQLNVIVVPMISPSVYVVKPGMVMMR